jgi:Zn-dependent protease with chaperone function
MHCETSAPANMHGFARSAIMLSACILAAALVLTPFALGRVGSSGPVGLIVAAAICLLSGLVAEALSSFVSRTSPFGAALIGMMVRMLAPLGVCVALLAAGQRGRDHLPFIAYLLSFYMFTLGLETWLAVKRSSHPPTDNRSPS